MSRDESHGEGWTGAESLNQPMLVVCIEIDIERLVGRSCHVLADAADSRVVMSWVP